MLSHVDFVSRRMRSAEITESVQKEAELEGFERRFAPT
jgi:hypothetical protein